MNDEAFFKQLDEKLKATDWEEEIYLLSMPRSANTVTRYILEHLTNYHSYGYIGSGGRQSVDNRGGVSKISANDRSSTGIIFKRHGWHAIYDPSPETKQSVILIVRNPLDLSLRRDPSMGGRLLPPEKQKKNAVAGFQLINDFLSYDGRKLVIFYEQLMTDPAGYVKKLANFIDANPQKLQAFLGRLTKHLGSPGNARKKLAPEQTTPNQCEPNIKRVQATNSVPTISTQWTTLIKDAPPDVRAFLIKHYGQDCKWRMV